MEIELTEGEWGCFGAFPASTHHWFLPDGQLWLSFARTDRAHWLRFPGLADFQVSLDGLQAVQSPIPATSTATLEHLFLNQVLPLAQSLQGALVFHASAVTLHGGAVAFLGRSGRGKSTLAASFATAGQAFLTDDGLQLELREGVYWVQPSHPSIRLWRDSREALVHADAQLTPVAQYSSKARVLSDERLNACRQPQPLRRMYFLGEGQVSDVEITPMHPREAMLGLVNHSFMLDTSTTSVLARHFDALCRMVSHNMFYTLDYPRHYPLLERVREVVSQHALALNLAQNSNHEPA